MPVTVRAVARRLRYGLDQLPFFTLRVPFNPLARRLTYRAYTLLSARLTALDVGLHSLAQLFQQEGPLQSHFHDRAVEAHPSNPGFLVRGLNFVQAALELDAFAVVCFFDAGGERGACCAFSWDCVMAH
jgi:hypothetical protein